MHQPERRETEQGAGYRYQPPLFDPQNVQEPLRPPKKRDGCVNAFAMLVALGVVFILLLAAAAALLVIFSALSETEEPYNTSSVVQVDADIEGLRDRYTKILGNREDQVTVMVYMIGSDLESDGAGAASRDIAEMLAAPLGDRVRLVLQTGGASSWETPGIEGGVCQRFELRDGVLQKKEDLGSFSTVEPEAVADFIRWASEHYPANRNILIFWDHGGGTAMGFGCDPYYPDDTLRLSEIGQALRDGGVKFDFIGFDACLMGTVETAYLLEPYADYLIASEETEPAAGWSYTRWLTELCQNSSLPTPETARVIIDDFVEGKETSSWDPCTLSLTELREIPHVYEKLCDYMENIAEEMAQKNYPAISTARANVRSYGDGGYEQVDIAAYTYQADYDGAGELRDAIASAVKYTRSNIEASYGLAMYFPYDSPEFYETMLREFRKMGYGGECITFFNRFVSILTDGRIQGGTSTLPGALFGEAVEEEEDYSGYSWYDENAWENYAGDDESLSGEDLTLIDKGEYYALHLPEEAWEQITYLELQVLVKDGDGYVDLGADNVYEWDEDGDLKVDFDSLWVAIEGQVVPFYAESEEIREDGSWITWGYVPAVLNGETDVNLMVFWSSEEPDGYVAGYRPLSEQMQTAGKGYRQLSPGDTLDFVCDYYSGDGEYSVWYWGEPITVGETPLSVSYEMIEVEEVDICFKLTDIYNRNLWTETVTLTY
jgi:hypothetical protein